MKSLLTVLLLTILSPSVSAAAPARYGLFVGNTRGEPGEVVLSYAEQDARRVARVMEHLGGVQKDNQIILIDARADRVRTALTELESRITRDRAKGAEDTLLFVYYSGHADGEALHLGETRLGLGEVRDLVRRSAAKFRVAVLDACRSGGLTQVKGVRPTSPFEIDLVNDLATEGTAFITSSAANEDSQESEAIGGSFFTHFLVSGLLGAADDSNDGRVSVTEAYRYAHERTVRATSRTWAGVQHPTFQYDVKGKGDIPLVDLSSDPSQRGALVFPSAGHYLVLRATDGPVVAEVETEQPNRRLLLEPGSYFVRVRRPAELEEGSVELPPASTVRLDTARFEHTRYARLVRKGSGPTTGHGLSVTYRYRGEILDGLGGMHGASIGYGVTLPWVSLAPHVSVGRSSSVGTAIPTMTTEIGLGVDVVKVVDLGPFSFAGGFELGLAYIGQDLSGQAPDHRALAPLLGAVLVPSLYLGGGLSVLGRAELVGYAIAREQPGGAVATAAPVTFVLGAGLGLEL